MREGEELTPLRRWLRIAGLAVTLFVLPILIILPFGDQLVDIARNLGSQSAAAAFLAVILLLALDSVALIPHGLIGALAGTALSWPLAAAATWLGIMAASCIAYAIGRFAGRPLARRLLGSDDLDAAEKRAAGISALLLFATRPVPVIGEVILIAAGIARYSFRRFLIAIGSANTVLALAYTGLGGAIGSSNPEQLMLIATLGIPAAGAVAYALIRAISKKR
ncbi:MAG: VTT domain-containing protein [Erythrobacter sp.]|nr:VTT domain-containing protein [Erythrobacter sp.]